MKAGVLHDFVREGKAFRTGRDRVCACGYLAELGGKAGDDKPGGERGWTHFGSLLAAMAASMTLSAWSSVHCENAAPKFRQMNGLLS